MLPPPLVVEAAAKIVPVLTINGFEVTELALAADNFPTVW
jgi:hypothetical protein